MQEIVDMIGLDFLNIQVCSISLPPAGRSQPCGKCAEKGPWLAARFCGDYMISMSMYIHGRLVDESL